MVSVYADGDAQEISGVSASTGEWSDADVFEFIDMATAGGDPTYDGNGRMLRQIVHGFWFTGSGESVEELADRRGQLFQFTTGDAGTIHFELFMDWIDVASREGVWMRTDLTVEVVDPTASASSASDAMVADSSFKPHMGFDAQFGSALVAALLATGGTEPEFALADLDGDGDADLADFAMFQAAFGTTGGTRYTWNTENRLTGVEPLAPSAGDVKVQFAYDHMGRRVLKRVWTYTAGSWGNPTAETKYVYDGWRVIMELDGLNSDAVTRKFTWGLDLSGSVEGAGGIGGLLAAEDTAGTTVATDDRSFIYFYELNGNVGQLVETTTGTDYGTIAAKYEYDPYGKRINTASPGEYDQPYRFSTKPVDDEPGLGYWIKRYYSYDLGRWVSRDPIGERGGVNLYAYVRNRFVARFDANGLCSDSANDEDDVPHPAADCGCPFTSKPMFIFKNCSEQVKDAFEKGASNVGKMWCDILGGLDDQESYRGILKCFEDQGMKSSTGPRMTPCNPNLESEGFIKNRLREGLKSLIDSKNPRVIECVCCDKLDYHTSGPVHTPNPGLFGEWKGQPIRVCNDRSMGFDNRVQMSHELLRWWIGDSKHQEWDNIERWDDAILCAFNKLIGKYGSTKKN